MDDQERQRLEMLLSAVESATAAFDMGRRLGEIVGIAKGRELERAEQRAKAEQHAAARQFIESKRVS
jgi:hypothetical protein